MTFNNIFFAALLFLGLIGCKKNSPTETDSQLPSVASTVAVAGGTFLMGGDGAYDGKPIHAVTVGSFTLDKFEVSYEKWNEVRSWGLAHGYPDVPEGRNGGTFSGTPSSGIHNPVTVVNWYDIVKWCNARSEKDSLTPVYYTTRAFGTVYRTGNIDLTADMVQWTASGYRLPTEAEWEFAARGGIHSHGYTYSGGNTADSVAWYAANAGDTTHQTGTKFPNELGIYDMTGNVSEWCWDLFEPYSSGTQTDPKGAAGGAYRVLRGGSFGNSFIYCRMAFRSADIPGNRDNNSIFGFRSARK